jgi:hypothetical protein
MPHRHIPNNLRPRRPQHQLLSQPQHLHPLEEAESEPRRLVAIAVKPCDGVDPEALYKKITTEITSQPEYKLKWDDKCKVENGKIYASFTIHLDADFDEEVMEMIEMMEEDVASQEITFMNAME